MRHKWSLLVIISVIFSIITFIPIGINNFILSWRAESTHGDMGDWISFLGSYIGAIIGGLVAVGVAIITVKLQHDRAQELKILELRFQNLPKLIKLCDDLEDVLDSVVHLRNTIEFFLNEKELNLDHMAEKIDYISKNAPAFVSINIQTHERDLYDISIGIKRFKQLQKIFIFIDRLNIAFEPDLVNELKELQEIIEQASEQGLPLLNYEQSTLDYKWNIMIKKRKEIYTLIYEHNYIKLIDETLDEVKEEIRKLEGLQDKYM